MPSKLISVLGATGNQGGSIVKTFLHHGWHVRAITRNTSSEKAQRLTEIGAEVVEANLDDAASLLTAFQGSNVVFAVSDFWGIYADPSSKDKAEPGQPLNVWSGQCELQQLKNCIDAAAETTALEHFIISSLPHATELSGGKYTHIYHFDSKAEAEKYGQKMHPELWAKTSIYLPAFFLTNFTQNPILKPVKGTDRKLRLATSMEPETKLELIAPEEDSGPFVWSMVQRGPGEALVGYREILTLTEIAAAFTEATGVATEILKLPKGQHGAPMDEHLQLELDENWAYLYEFGYMGQKEDVLHPHDLRPQPQLETVVDYLRKQHQLGVI